MAPESVQSPAQMPAEDEAAFENRGLVAPETKQDVRKDAAALDLAKLRDAFGPATEVRGDQLARFENKGREEAERVVTLDSAPVSAGEADDEDSGYRESARSDPADRPARPTPPPPPPPAAPAKKKPSESLDFAQSTTGRFDDDVSKGGDGKLEEPKLELAKEKDKGKKQKNGHGEDGDTGAPDTLLPAIARRPSLGKVLVRGEDGKMTALVPRAIRVVAHVQGPRARTVVDYVFENPHGRQLEGTFYHPLPADASPAGFAMFDGTARVTKPSFFQSNRLLPPLRSGAINEKSLDLFMPAGGRGRGVKWGRKQDAIVVEQKRARQVYEEIVRSQVDPALLEWSGGSNFEARVFPIEPNSLKRVVVAYEQPLVFDGENHRYGYTLPPDKTIVERSATFFADVQHGEVVKGPAGAKQKRAGRWARFDVANAKPGAALELAVRAPARHAVLRGKDTSGLSGDAFYAEVRPELPKAGDRATGRAILLVDTSLSSEEGGAHARRAELIQQLLERDRSIEQYAVMLFDVRPRWLHDIGWRSNTPENRDATIRDLRRVYLEGATSFASVLEEIDKQREWAVDGAPTTVFLLSDGEITWGLDREEALPARHPILSSVRWITYRFGEAPANTTLFDLLSNRSGGRTVDVLSSADVAAAAVAHRRLPVELTSVSVEGAPSVDVTTAGDPRLVFPGQTLKIAGRLPSGGKAKLVVNMTSGGQTKRVEVPLDRKGDHFAPRAWAELHTKRLVGLDDPRVDRMVVALSQHYRLANARASFLILESESQIAQYDLKNEQVDLSNLERLREAEADQRRLALLGLGLDAVTPANRKLLENLRRITDGMKPVLRPQPLLELPYAGGNERITEEIAYRAARKAEKNDILIYERVARARALVGDTSGAVRALSSTVELRPRDAEAMRLVGYALLAVAQYDVAAELFERIRLLRPFEPQSFLEEALALDAEGRWAEAARNYEIVLGRSWPRHDEQSKTTARLHYARLLTEVLAQAKPRDKKPVATRLASLSEGGAMDYQLTIHWSTDSVDIDLWVFEPSGEKCFYQNTNTASGGRLLWDVTDGLGPEVYQAPSANIGAYDTLVHFYGSGAPRMQAPTALLMVVDESPWTASGTSSRKFLMRMLPKRDAVLMMRTDYFQGT